ncbi:TolC family protein [Phenylobacterium immobile]|uniref:TolC family protein n=1 Tax=Phenylobacterium immobile TaxID=21 RepID=UPI000B0FB363|nr:TolC family protein [Phenylobacterium immobile]
MLPDIRRPPWAVLLAIAGVWAADAAMAGPAPPYATLLAQSRATGPQMAESAASVAQAEGLALQARSRPNPVISVQRENFSGSGPYRGADLAETTATIQQTLELGGKRAARVAAGRAAVLAAQARNRASGADFAALLAIGYAEAEAADARLGQSAETLAAAESDAKVARQLVTAGREAALRGLQAEAERQAAAADREEAQALRDIAFARLSALAGSAISFDSLSESLLARTGASTVAVEVETPAITAARAEREAAAARVRAEARRAVPDVTVSAGVRRLAGDDATAFVAGVSAPFPLFDRNRGATQAARAELNGAEARLRQAEFDAAADALAALSQARSAQARVEASAASEAAAVEAYRLARLGYEAGRLPLLELSSARRAQAAARVRTLDARLAQVRAQAEIARLSGRIPFGG